MTTSNDVTIVGNLTRDPELRYLQSGTPLASFGVACNRRYQKNNEWEEETSFFDCTAWRDTGENIAESLSKGDRVIISGRLEQRTWETDDGQKRSKIEVVVDDIGPSLRWATTVVSKVSKSGGDNSGASHTPPAAAYEEAEEPF